MTGEGMSRWSRRLRAQGTLNRRVRLRLLTAVAAFALLAPASAGANTTDTIISDCEMHSQLTGHYSPSQLQQALHSMPADVTEYSDCPTIVRQALLGLVSGGGGGAGPGGTPPPVPTATELQALHAASQAAQQPVRLAQQILRPGRVNADLGSGLDRLPAPLLAFLVLTVVAALAGGAKAVFDRVRPGSAA